MNLSEYKILIVDDDPDIIEFLSYNLRKEGFDVHSETNGKDAFELLQKFTPHLILLDVMMPGMDGIEICERIRENPLYNDIFIVILTARSEDYSQIAGFNAGADDFITKPVKTKVLVSRLLAILRRHGTRRPGQNSTEEALRFNDILIDRERHTVFRGNNELELPRKEFKLLVLLTSKPSRVFTREEIFDHLWGTDIFVGDRTIDVYIRKLREKIGEERIKTVKGVGYKFEV